MCISKIKVYNNSKIIGKRQFVRLYNYVNCGKCCECQKQKSSEWIARTYYHSNDILKHGYILFDTLTYKDEFVPLASSELRKYDLSVSQKDDFTCFSRRHVQLFFKRLRKKLSTLYPDFRFSYFLASEYGTSDYGTHRPHYHLLLFSPSYVVKPAELSAYIHQCWHLGRTDGIYENDYQTFISDKVLSGYSGRVIKAAQYIAKYVEKDSTFQSVIDDRLQRIYYKLHTTEVVKPSKYKYSLPVTQLKEIESQPFMSYSLRLKYNRIKHVIEQFHLQSKHFGLSGLQCNIVNILHKDVISVPDTNIGERFIPVPLYYLNKLIRTKVKDCKGVVSYPLNPVGIEYYKTRVKRQFDNYVIKYNDLSKNVDFNVSDYLQGFTIDDFVRYKLYYQNRITFGNLPHIDDVTSLNLVPIDEINPTDYIYQFHTSSDCALLGNRYVSLDSKTLIPSSLYYKDHVYKYMPFEILDSKFIDFVKTNGIAKQNKYNLSQRISKQLKLSI